MFEIFTHSDPALLKSVLDAVIMVLSVGGLGAGQGMGIAMAIGFLVAIGSTLFNGMQGFNKFIAAFIIWFFLVGFTYGQSDGNKVDVVISAPNGASAIVSDAPPGIMMFYSVITKISSGLTDLFDIAFTLPDRISGENGTLIVPKDPYIALLRLRDAQLTKMSSNIDTINMRETVKSFIISCINDGNTSQGIRENINDYDFTNITLKGNTSALETKLYFDVDADKTVNPSSAPFGPENPAQVSCDTALDQIQSKFDSVEFGNLLTSDLKMNSKVDIQSAKNLFDTITGTNATQGVFLQNKFFIDVAEEIAADDNLRNELSGLELSGRLINYQARLDRSLKQAQERSFNMETWTLIISVVEVFTYFVSAFMPFILILSGGYLLKIVVSWLTLIVWVNLLPITHIIGKLFTEYYTAFSVRCAEDSLACPSFSSVGALDASYTTIETALGISGTITAVIPSLTFFLLSGSSYALMSSMGAVSTKASPDTSNMNPKAGGSWSGDGVKFNSSNTSGVMSQGQVALFSAVAPTSGNFSNATSVDAGTAQTGAVTGLSKSLSVTEQSTVNEASQFLTRASNATASEVSTNSSITSSDVQTGKFMTQASNAIKDTTSLSGQVADQIATKVTLGTPTVLAGISGSQQETEQALIQAGIGQDQVRQIMQSEEAVAALQELAQFTESVRNTEGFEDSQLAQYTEAYANTRTEQDTLNNASSLAFSGSSGMSQKVDFKGDDIVTNSELDNLFNASGGFWADSLMLEAAGLNANSKNNSGTSWEDFSQQRAASLGYSSYDDLSSIEKANTAREFIDSTDSKAKFNNAADANLASMNEQIRKEHENSPIKSETTQSIGQKVLAQDLVSTIAGENKEISTQTNSVDDIARNANQTADLIDVYSDLSGRNTSQFDNLSENYREFADALTASSSKEDFLANTQEQKNTLDNLKQDMPAPQSVDSMVSSWVTDNVEQTQQAQALERWEQLKAQNNNPTDKPEQLALMRQFQSEISGHNIDNSDRNKVESQHLHNKAEQSVPKLNNQGGVGLSESQAFTALETLNNVKGKALDAYVNASEPNTVDTAKAMFKAIQQGDLETSSAEFASWLSSGLNGAGHAALVSFAQQYGSPELVESLNASRNEINGYLESNNFKDNYKDSMLSALSGYAQYENEVMELANRNAESLQGKGPGELNLLSTQNGFASNNLFSSNFKPNAQYPTNSGSSFSSSLDENNVGTGTSFDAKAVDKDGGSSNSPRTLTGDAIELSSNVKETSISAAKEITSLGVDFSNGVIDIASNAVGYITGYNSNIVPASQSPEIVPSASNNQTADLSTSGQTNPSTQNGNNGLKLNENEIAKSLTQANQQANANVGAGGGSESNATGETNSVNTSPALTSNNVQQGNDQTVTNNQNADSTNNTMVNPASSNQTTNLSTSGQTYPSTQNGNNGLKLNENEIAKTLAQANQQANTNVGAGGSSELNAKVEANSVAASPALTSNNVQQGNDQTVTNNQNADSTNNTMVNPAPSNQAANLSTSGQNAGSENNTMVNPASSNQTASLSTPGQTTPSTQNGKNGLKLNENEIAKTLAQANQQANTNVGAGGSSELNAKVEANSVAASPALTSNNVQQGNDQTVTNNQNADSTNNTMVNPAPSNQAASLSTSGQNPGSPNNTMVNPAPSNQAANLSTSGQNAGSANNTMVNPASSNQAASLSTSGQNPGSENNTMVNPASSNQTADLSTSGQNAGSPNISMVNPASSNQTASLSTPGQTTPSTQNGNSGLKLNESEIARTLAQANQQENTNATANDSSEFNSGLNGKGETNSVTTSPALTSNNSEQGNGQTFTNNQTASLSTSGHNAGSPNNTMVNPASGNQTANLSTYGQTTPSTQNGNSSLRLNESEIAKTLAQANQQENNSATANVSSEINSGLDGKGETNSVTTSPALTSNNSGQGNEQTVTNNQTTSLSTNGQAGSSQTSFIQAVNVSNSVENNSSNLTSVTLKNDMFVSNERADSDEKDKEEKEPNLALANEELDEKIQMVNQDL